jgi:hypothetical protein
VIFNQSLKTSVREILQNTYAKGKELLKRLGSAYVSMLSGSNYKIIFVVEGGIKQNSSIYRSYLSN